MLGWWMMLNCLMVTSAYCQCGWIQTLSTSNIDVYGNLSASSINVTDMVASSIVTDNLTITGTINGLDLHLHTSHQIPYLNITSHMDNQKMVYQEFAFSVNDTAGSCQNLLLLNVSLPCDPQMLLVRLTTFCHGVNHIINPTSRNPILFSESPPLDLLTRWIGPIPPPPSPTTTTPPTSPVVQPSQSPSPSNEDSQMKWKWYEQGYKTVTLRVLKMGDPCEWEPYDYILGESVMTPNMWFGYVTHIPTGSQRMTVAIQKPLKKLSCSGTASMLYVY